MILRTSDGVEEEEFRFKTKQKEPALRGGVKTLVMRLWEVDLENVGVRVWKKSLDGGIFLIGEEEAWEAANRFCSMSPQPANLSKVDMIK